VGGRNAMPKRGRSSRGRAFTATLLALLFSLAIAGGPTVASPGQAAGQGGRSSAGQLEKEIRKASVDVRHLPEAKAQKHTLKPARSGEHKLAAVNAASPASVVSRSDGQSAALGPSNVTTEITTDVLTGGGAGGSIELEQFDGALNTGPTPPHNRLGGG